ncbi:MAG TPA: hypothetical protein VNP73_03525 [Actinomycetota bacterium]|nr:hypothetical protein [Actinomycetota bacterium]
MTRTARALSTSVALCLIATFVVVGSNHSALAQQALPCDNGSNGDYSGDYAKLSEKGPYEIGKQEVVNLDSDLDGATIQRNLR